MVSQFPQKIDEDIRRSLELHADRYAVDRILGLYEKSEETSVVDFCSRWLIAISVLFILINPKPNDLYKWKSVDYPHPHLRFSELCMITQAVFKRGFGITIEEWDDIVKYWTQNIAYLEVFGEDNILPPFTHALNFQQEFISKAEHYQQIIQDHINDFERAREEMCSWLA